MENGLFIQFLSMIAIRAANFCSVPVTGPGPAAANVSTRHTLTTGVPCILVWVIHTCIRRWRGKDCLMGKSLCTSVFSIQEALSSGFSCDWDFFDIHISV